MGRAVKAGKGTVSLGHELEEPVPCGFSLLKLSKADTELPILSLLLIQENLYDELVSFHIQFIKKYIFLKILTNSLYNHIAPTSLLALGLLHLSYKKTKS